MEVLEYGLCGLREIRLIAKMSAKALYNKMIKYGGF